MADAVNRPAHWLSDGPVTATLWTRLHADHGRSGLWPLLPEGLDDEPARPWLVGEVDPEPVSDIDEHDPAGFFAKRWAANVAPPNDEWLQEFQEESGVDYFDQVSPLAAVVRSWEGWARPCGLRRADLRRDVVDVLVGLSGRPPRGSGRNKG